MGTGLMDAQTPSPHPVPVLFTDTATRHFILPVFLSWGRQADKISLFAGFLSLPSLPLQSHAKAMALQDRYCQIVTNQTALWM